MYEKLTERLCRYSMQCVKEKFDPDFACAIREAVEVIKELENKRASLQEKVKELESKRVTLQAKIAVEAESHCKTVEQMASEAETHYNVVKQLRNYLKDLRNEMCQKCGKYKYAHEGACDSCRWKEGDW